MPNDPKTELLNTTSEIHCWKSWVYSDIEKLKSKIEQSKQHVVEAFAMIDVNTVLVIPSFPFKSLEYIKKFNDVKIESWVNINYIGLAGVN